jgi:hypothetical protein
VNSKCIQATQEECDTIGYSWTGCAKCNANYTDNIYGRRAFHTCPGPFNPLVGSNQRNTIDTQLGELPQLQTFLTEASPPPPPPPPGRPRH